MIRLLEDDFSLCAPEPSSQWLGEEPAFRLSGAVYNWDELRTLSGLHSPSTPYAQVCQRLYRRYNCVFVAHFIGEFCAYYWDPSTQTVLFFADKMGIRTLHYTRASGQHLFSTELAVAVASQPRLDWDEEALGFSLFWHRPEPHRSWYRNVFTLPPAHLWKWDHRGLRLERYWEFQPQPELAFRDPEEGERAFRETLRRAVADRVRTVKRTAVLLSGGVDSAAVTALAASEQGDRLVTLSNVFDDPVADNRLRITEVVACAAWPHRWLEPERQRSYLTLDPTGELRDVPFEPLHYMFRLPFTEAVRLGAGLALTGLGGDDVLSPPETSLGESLAAGDWQEVGYLLREQWQQGPHYFGYFLRANLARHVPRQWVRHLRRWLPRRAPGWLSPAFAKRYGVLDRLAQDLSASLKLPGPVWRQHLHARLFGTLAYPMGREQEQRLAARHGLRLGYPFFDERVVRLAFQMPLSFLVRRGVHKWVLRKSMEGLLPKSVLYQLNTQDYNGFQKRVFQLEESRLSRYVKKPLLSELGILDLQGVWRLWKNRSELECRRALIGILALEHCVRLADRSEFRERKPQWIDRRPSKNKRSDSRTRPPG